MTAGEFIWFDPGKLQDNELELVLAQRMPADPVKDWAPSYVFQMIRSETGRSMGSINLRIGTSEHLVKYAGQIGYGVDEQFRGNRYAVRSCLLIFPLAKLHGINPLWITCNPENTASRRTCELAGGIYVETVDVPPDTEMYKKGDKRKRRYRFDL
jgi:tagatose 1,6-diphosphate aldolase